MANSTIPNLVAVSVPALTDLFGVRQSGDTRDKKLTVTQLLTLVPSASVPDPLLLNAGAVGAPTYSYTGDDDTGVFNVAADQLSLAAGGVEIARATEAPGANQFAVVASGNSSVPDLTGLADPDTGFRWTGSNEIITINAGSRSWHFLSTAFFADASDGPIIFNTFGSATVPSICVERSDADTGLGRGANDAISLICGGVEGLRLTEAASGVIQVPEAGLAITAFATGGQGSAVQLNSSYNVIGTVATTGDSVKLLPTFAVNSVVYVKNDGVNAADVFPGAGDDLGAGTDTAISLAAGESASFIATVANLTWTPWIVSVGGGGGIAAVVDDPSPQLGGDLDTNGSNIVNDDTTLIGLSITAGTPAAGKGGDLNLTSGVSGVGATDDGGDVIIRSGNSVAANGDGGGISIKTGDGSIAAEFGGDLVLEVGQGAGVGASGNFFVNTITGIGAAGGSVSSNQNPGLVSMYGIGFTGEDPAGNLELWGGYASGSTSAAVGGNLMLFGGGQGGGGSGTGGNAMLIGGESETQPGNAVMVGGVAVTGGVGGQAVITGGAGFSSNFNGGDVVLSGGAAAGAGNVGLVRTPNASGPAFLNESSTTINPTLIPNRTDLNTGIGGTAADELSLIAGGVQIAQAKEASGANQFIIAPGVVQDAAATPSLAFGDGNTGFFESADNTLKISIGNAARWQFQANNFLAENSAGPFMFNTAATSSSSPVMGPNRGDNNTGFGHGAADQLDFICGGLNCITVRTVTAARQIGFYNATPVAQQTGVAVSSAGIHAALVTLGLITA